MRKAAFALSTIVLAFALLSRVGSTAPAAPSVTAAGSLRATLWAQTATEHDACTLQAYRLAERQLGDALADGCWTADVAQAAAGGYQDKAPAVILDVDETVLDNSPAQARLLREVLDGKRDSDTFDLKGWETWVSEHAAGALPGARHFLHTARDRGVATFFVTNRIDTQKDATIANLVAVGIDATPDTVITSNDAAGRPSDKTSRRATIAASYRILLLIGDDLSDCVSGVRKVSPAERAAVLAAHRDYVGTRWILLPNAVYGSWLDSLGGSPADSLRTK
jgi:5'-nucleotidase (lipoprotein e(P4) family)